MSERFAERWAILWALLPLPVFLFGVEAIPRALNFSVAWAAILGALWGTIAVGPIVWVSFRS